MMLSCRSLLICLLALMRIHMCQQKQAIMQPSLLDR